MGGHPSHLPVAAFRDRQGNPRIRHRFAKTHRRVALPKVGWRDQGHLGRARWTVFESDTITQRLQVGVGGGAFNLGVVGLGQLVFGVADLGLQFAIISQDQQPLAVAIKASGGIDLWNVNEI